MHHFPRRAAPRGVTYEKASRVWGYTLGDMEIEHILSSLIEQCIFLAFLLLLFFCCCHTRTPFLQLEASNRHVKFTQALWPKFPWFSAEVSRRKQWSPTAIFSATFFRDCLQYSPESLPQRRICVTDGYFRPNSTLTFSAVLKKLLLYCKQKRVKADIYIFTGISSL